MYRLPIVSIAIRFVVLNCLILTIKLFGQGKELLNLEP